MHGKAAQPHAQKQTGQARVARHFTANTDFFALQLALMDGVGNQLQHGRVQRVIHVRHRLIGAVNRQGVLDQIIGADGQKVEILQKRAQRQRGGGNFNHCADFDRAIHRTARVEIGSGLVK